MPSSYAIGKHFETFIKQQIKSGRYRSASEIIRDALRLLEDREKLRKIEIANLSREVQEGRESGEGIPATELFDRLEEKYKKLATKS